MTRIALACRWLLLAVALSLLGGCASFYVEGRVPEIPSAQFKKPAQPRSAQLLWEFQTNGVSNGHATRHLLARVRDQVSASGLFSSISDGPDSEGATLSVIVNNVPLSSDAALKGFLTGITFGLAGQTVADGYECTVQYRPGRGAATALEHRARHAIFTSLGNASPPPGVLAMPDVGAAISLVLRQLISRTLNELSQEPAFP